MIRFSAFGLSLVFGLTSVYAQPKFEVASIKPCAAGGRPGIGAPSPGRLTVNCFTVMNLIRNAYIMFADGRMNPPGKLVPIEKGPGWIDSDTFTIEATAEGAPGQAQMLGPMMQALLEERFRLRIHAESREVPVYVLTLGTGGTGLQSSQPGSCVAMDVDHLPPPPKPGQPLPAICKMARVTASGFDVRGVTMAELCQSLSARMDRDVMDRTGIAGVFDFRVEMSPGAPGPGLPPPPPPPPVTASGPMPPTISGDPDELAAAIRKALQKFGLKLESARGPGRFFVIDRVERPSEN